MNRKLTILSLLLLLALAVAACGGATANPEAALDSGDAAMTEDDSMAGEASMEAEKAMAGDDSMAGEADMEGEEAMAGTKAGDAAMAGDDSMAGDEAMMELPAWFQAELTDVNTGETFTLADLQGKVILVETMAIWCSNCLRQQQEVKALHEALGERDDLLTVVLDIDANEDAASLQEYTARHGFNWIYAVAPREVAREIGQLYGDQFLNPPSTPMLIVDPHGEVHLLPFGRKTAADLEEALAPFLGEGM